MGADQHLDWQTATAGLLDWWVEAGVDTLVDEEPRDWRVPAPVAATVPIAAPSAEAMPSAWDAFARWRNGPGAPEHGWPGGWIAATGPAQAPLMVLTDCPDRDDLADGSLLAGDAGRLFERMLAAIDLRRDAVHVASLCAKRPIAGRLPADAEQRLAAIARHHVALVGPRALLVMGNAASRAILATDVAAARGPSHGFNHSGGKAVVVASYHPRFLLERPAAKAAAWADLRAVKRSLEGIAGE